MKLVDLTGQRFGRLVVLRRADNIGRQTAWLCKCDCGNESIVLGYALRRGTIQSCGCGRNEAARERGKVNARKHGGIGTRLYSIWRGMKLRCYNPKAKAYHRYGGRGITLCDEWRHDFATFRDWALNNGYADNLTIDRINNDRGYSPENCRWITMKAQADNRSNSKIKYII